jgi:signal transduction histidine kinase
VPETPRPATRLVGFTRSPAARGRQLPPIAVDTALASLCLATVVLYGAVHEYLVWWVVALGVLNTAPLLWRQRFPFTATWICGISTTWMSVLGVIGEFPAAQLVATYTFAVLCPPAQRLLCGIGTIIGVSISIGVHGEFLQIAPTSAMFLLAYAIGTSTRARRDRLAMLEERSRRLAEEQESAAARERERIAREMHDILAHSMSLVIVQAEAGPVVVRTNPDKAEQTFRSISDTARDALGELRRVLGVLRAGDGPSQPALRPLPGLDDIPTLADGVRTTGLTVVVEERGERRPLAAVTAVTAYRIVQEALSNTVKHAGAAGVQLRLDWSDEELRLVIHDDGRGPDMDRTGFGHGLVGMRERVSAAGGQLVYGPGPDGTGFEVAASLPVGPAPVSIE